MQAIMKARCIQNVVLPIETDPPNVAAKTRRLVKKYSHPLRTYSVLFIVSFLVHGIFDREHTEYWRLGV